MQLGFGEMPASFSSEAAHDHRMLGFLNYKISRELKMRCEVSFEKVPD